MTSVFPSGVFSCRIQAQMPRGSVAADGDSFVDGVGNEGRLCDGPVDIRRPARDRSVLGSPEEYRPPRYRRVVGTTKSFDALNAMPVGLPVSAGFPEAAGIVTTSGPGGTVLGNATPLPS